MNLTFEIRVENQDMVERVLAKLLTGLTDLSALMERFAAYLEFSTVERFETNVGPDGKPWKPSIRAQLFGGPTLVERGLLRDSITSASGADWAQVGTNDPRARIHQLGGVIEPVQAKALRFQLPGDFGWRIVKRVVMPARPFVGLSSDDTDEILALARDYLVELGAAA